MSGYIWPFFRKALFRLDPEAAHDVTVRVLALRNTKKPKPDAASLAIRSNALGLSFSNPLGVAAGFDKDARVPGAIRALGFGFAEIGTVTPQPQSGNPQPRLFRLEKDRAVINRLGFNNAGHDCAFTRLAAAKARGVGPIGVNLGANKTSSDRVADYLTGIARFSPLADYFAINISSPNTPGLRALQSRAALQNLLDRLVERRAQQQRQVPIFLKVAPDLTEGDRHDIAEVALAAGIEGLIVSNTTLSRPTSLLSDQKGQAGGLSGAPLMALSTEILADFYRLTGGKLVLIGVGGVASGADAYAKIRAGASLVQLYTALIYQGPALIKQIKRDLIAFMQRDGFTHIGEAVGADHR
ncbi:dihydroorotate dehydrogenase (quinone) [Iodidimonas gelatinilytica]|uniref:Dihydroorotate dehydrogenase (quinone) n=1 Tax=Iodidimonas gelatinilytica TaxID=1236966 RepID=A0A5A7MZD8_9PROT|nr:quinone-dependent dihydroorotate dehydrogenase [Iodidimonas gelatinilytica]GER00774.1 dihydroorotate dehydrogenase (quinone) [Iodidimonas gelatinilytica]